MIYDQWRRWIDAFEDAVAQGTWDALDPFVTDDVRYIVSGSPYACDLRGREAVLGGLRRSVERFDLKFERREWRAGAIKVLEPNCIKATVVGTYETAGRPPLRFGVEGVWFFAGDRICLMTDLYDLSMADMTEALGWLDAHAADLGVDAAYR